HGLRARLGCRPRGAREGCPRGGLRFRRLGPRRGTVSTRNGMTNLLLLSNSTEHGRGYLDHAMPAIRDLLGPVRRLVFVPFALREREAYTARVRARFEKESVDVQGLGPDGEEAPVLHGAEAVFVGGGNTFRLLDTLQRSGLLDALSRRERGGVQNLGPN